MKYEFIQKVKQPWKLVDGRIKYTAPVVFECEAKNVDEAKQKFREAKRISPESYLIQTKWI